MIIRLAMAWLFNSALGRLVLARVVRPSSLFLYYPATQTHAQHYGWRFLRNRHAWTPCILGLARQRGRWCLITGIGAKPSELWAAQNHHRLAALVQQLNKLAVEMGASHVSYAGQLPDLLQARQLTRSSGEAAATSQVLFQATVRLLGPQGAELDSLLLLGGKTLVGLNLHRMLCQTGGIGPDAVRCMDAHDAMPTRGRYLVVNCAEPTVLERLASAIPEGSIVLNETYPAPRPAVCELLARRAVTVYHLAGLRGHCWPALPGEFKGAVPCGAIDEADPSTAVIHGLNTVQACASNARFESPEFAAL